MRPNQIGAARPRVAMRSAARGSRRKSTQAQEIAAIDAAAEPFHERTSPLPST
jgi:hypothetical protein